jgi:HEAT repeat protein
MAVIVVAAAQAAADTTAADLQQLQTTLNSPDSAPAQREDAARTLVDLASPPALSILQTSFQTSGNLPTQLAIARALQQSPNPDPSFIPLLGGAMGSNVSLTDAAAQALVNYRNNPDIFPLLRNKLGNMALPDGSRVKIVTAMGNVLEQRAADYLIGVLKDQSNYSGQVRAAAANALGEMTGLVDNGQDLQRWQQWWQTNQNKPQDQWQADLLATRSRQAAQIKQRYTGLKEAIKNLVRSTYSLTPPDRKEATLLRYLAPDQVPEIRTAGANLVAQDFTDNRVIPPTVLQRLREMISDSDREVREAVIDTLGNINDQQAAPALITQLGHETDLQTRLEIASALGRMNNLAAVPVLLEMLDHNYFAEASAAADALAKLGEKLRQNDPPLARQATDALQRTLDTRSADPSAGDLRANCVRALAELADPRSLGTFMNLLTPTETDAVHVAALRGLQLLNNPDSLDHITPFLSDTNVAVQLQAAQALENLAGFAQADQLYGMLAPPTDPRVRDAVWQDLQKIFKTGTVEQLNIWPDRFKNDPEKRLVALQALRAALVRENKDSQVIAGEDQDIGDTLKELTPKRLDDAVQSYQRALDYWSSAGKNQPGGDAKLDALVGAMLDTLLEGKKYQEASDFSATQLKISKTYEHTVGAKLKNEAQRLKDAGDPTDARQLIEAALKIPWPENSSYLGDLKDVLDQLNAASPTPAAQ